MLLVGVSVGGGLKSSDRNIFFYTNSPRKNKQTLEKHLNSTGPRGSAGAIRGTAKTVTGQKLETSSRSKLKQRARITKFPKIKRTHREGEPTKESLETG